jgi:chondroitin 4-sulfotransferase 11
MNKFIFIHIPKTAGTSIKTTLDFVKYRTNHRTLKNLINLEPPTGIDWPWQKDGIENYFKFAFVRNPWDRAVSSYFYWANKYHQRIKNKQNSNIPNPIKERQLRHMENIYAIIEKHKDFKGFYRHFADNPKALHSLCPVFNVQSRWVDPRLDFIGTYENLIEDMRYICDQVGVPFMLQHQNASDHKSYRAYYDDELVDCVATIYERDISTLDYSYDDF